MRRPRVLFIRSLMKILYLQFIDIEGPETLEQFFIGKGYESDIIRLYKGQPLPENLNAFSAVVCLGGPMNVYEEEKYPHLKWVDILIKDILKKEIPYLGLCLGSQLLAKASGGKVVKSPREEIGWYQVDLQQDPLFEGIDNPLEVFHWHGDMFEISSEAKMIAMAEGCPNQAFRVGKNAYGLQFHVEITRPSIDTWSRAYAPDMEERRQGMLARYDHIQKKYDAEAQKLYENFYQIMTHD